MASLSYNVNLDRTITQPINVGVGTNAPGAGDLEVRVNLATAPTTKDIILKLQDIIMRLEDGQYGPGDVGNV